MKIKLKKGDKVRVIAGDDRGKTGEILQVLRDKNRVVIDGVNVVKKHVKKSQELPNGGIIEKCLPIHVSNVVLLKEDVKSTVDETK